MNKKTKVIAIMNNKGGVLKTTLVTNIAGVLIRKNKKVLIIDTDPQSNIFDSFSRTRKSEYSLTEALINDVDINKAIQTVEIDKYSIDILPSSPELNQFEALIYSGKKTYKAIDKVLQNVLQKVKQNYDFIIIDTAPYMNLLSANVINCADTIIVPSQMELYSYNGLIILDKAIKDFNGKIDYIVPVQFDGRTKIHKEILSQISRLSEKENFKLTNTKISRSVKAASSIYVEGVPLTLSKNKGTIWGRQYDSLVKEILGEQ